MKRFFKCLFCVLAGLVLFVPLAHAVCPVCTIAIGAGLEGMRVLGVKDVLTGIWAGGLTVSLIGWTANYMRKHNVKNPIWYVLNAVVYIALLAGVYFFPVNNPIVKWWDNCMWAVDQFLLGVLVGAITFIVMELWYLHIKKKNGGHALFPFQKVVMPFVGLLLMTGIFWAIIRLLPQYGIVLC
jgi:hypothetical protein